MNALITGTSSGLGFELAKRFQKEDRNVYGISRSKTNLPINQMTCDFSDLDSITDRLEELIDTDEFDYIVLNAGILGRISHTKDLSVSDYNEIININVLSNKVILDYMLNKCSIKNVIGISSGAALKTYIGWSLYCCSKACFNQLISSYSHEYTNTHFISLAPGIIKTKMQDYIYSQDEIKFPSLFQVFEIPSSLLYL